MANDDFYDIQILFQNYIETTDPKRKELLIEEYKKQLPQRAKLIDELKKVIDGLNINIQKEFVEQLNNSMIDMESLVYNLQSQADNKTVSNNKVEVETVDIISFHDFVKEKTTESCGISDNKIILNDNSQKVLTQVTEEDTRFYNYLVEKLIYNTIEDLYLINTSKHGYIGSNNALPQTGTFTMVKEEALCDPLIVKDHIDKIIGSSQYKNAYLQRIFIDIITNQNYRSINNGFGVINSDLKQYNYYAIDGKTLRKEYAIESFLRNYYDSVEVIIDLIMDNYNIISNLISDMLKSGQFNRSYLINIENNIKMLHDSVKVKTKIDNMTADRPKKVITMEEIKEQEDKKTKRNELNAKFEENVTALRKSLGLNNQSLNKVGYVSLFTIVSGIVIFGILLAYLFLKI